MKTFSILIIFLMLSGNAFAYEECPLNGLHTEEEHQFCRIANALEKIADDDSKDCITYTPSGKLYKPK